MKVGILQKQTVSKHKIGSKVAIIGSPYFGIEFKPFYTVKEHSETSLCMLDCEQYGRVQRLAFYDTELTAML